MITVQEIDIIQELEKCKGDILSIKELIKNFVPSDVCKKLITACMLVAEAQELMQKV